MYLNKKEKEQFIFDYRKTSLSMSALCKLYGISRPTAYRILKDAGIDIEGHIRTLTVNAIEGRKSVLLSDIAEIDSIKTRLQKTVDMMDMALDCLFKILEKYDEIAEEGN